ncbi:Uma2 family endonuclease [Streptomyces sp. NRRL B-24484]|uniref:Uma2 family endonuclease n=1 Tax=Streptomyces sp. NRRL B-24484 TaxID=1463833 RepID=UPI0004BF9A0F|nr:Uma2 family endonuclease [Streptomyces sp. NRRL B-24484]
MAALLSGHIGPWTVDNVLALPEATSQIELAGGTLLVSANPDVPHQRARSALAARLAQAAEAGAAPLEVLPAVPVLMPDGLLIPDLIIADAAAAAEATSALDAGAVVVAIEITTPSTRMSDTVLKTALYAAAGIPHHWRLGLDPAPRLYLERGTYVDRLVQAGETTALTDPFLFDLDPAALRR